MYRIYFNNRCLAVCSPKHTALSEPDATIYSPETHPPLSELARYFDQTPTLEKLYISTEDKPGTIARITSDLTPITAAGGIVTNKKGEYLIIFHHGVWDFPKGMQEPDEEIGNTAIREVEEECGVHDLKILNYLSDTFHTYHRNGLFYLKTTHWYLMEYQGNGTETHPQQEEEIERAIWVPARELPSYLDTSYPAIRYLYQRALATT